MKKRIPTAIVLAAYAAFLVKVMVFKDIGTIKIGQLMMRFGGTDTGHAPNFIPFKTIGPYLLGYKGWIIAGANLVGNVGLLVPVGFMLPFVYRNITWKKALVIAVASGLAIETLQVVLRVGIFDIDDMILNAIGVMIGYAASLLLMRWLREKKYLYIVLVVLAIMAAAAGALYAIYPHNLPVR